MQVVGGGECLVELTVEVVELIVAVASGLEIDEGDESAVGLEPEVLMLKALQAEDEETGCAEESDGERGLQDDESALKAADVAGRAVGSVQSFGGIEARGHERGSDAKEYSGECGDGEGEEENRQRGRCAERIDGDAFHDDGKDGFDAGIGDEESESAAEDGEGDGLDEHLTDET